MIDIGVFPPVPEIRLIGVVYDKPVSQKNAEPLRGQPVVLVDLGDPLWKGVHEVVNRVRQRHLNQRMVRKDARDLAAERLVHPVVVVGVQKAALLEVAPQGAELDVGEMHVPVAGHIDVRDVPQLRPGQRHHALAIGDRQRRPLAQRGQQVRQARGIGVPVAAAVVMQAADRERSRAWCVVRRAWCEKQH